MPAVATVAGRFERAGNDDADDADDALSERERRESRKRRRSCCCFDWRSSESERRRRRLASDLKSDSGAPAPRETRAAKSGHQKPGY